MISFSEFRITNLRKDQVNNNINHFLSRHFVNPVGYFFYRLGFTPNQVTYVFIVIGLLSAAAFYFHYVTLGYFLWRAHIIVDMADGAVARATKVMSDYGVILDKVGHHIINPLIWISILHSLNALETHGMLCILFYAAANAQWTTKHLVKRGEKHFNGMNYLRRIVANIMGMEGFILGALLIIKFPIIQVDMFLMFYIITNSVLLIIKLKKVLRSM